MRRHSLTYRGRFEITLEPDEGGAPVWLPEGAVAYADWTTADRYWAGGALQDVADLMGPALVRDASGLATTNGATSDSVIMGALLAAMQSPTAQTQVWHMDTPTGHVNSMVFECGSNDFGMDRFDNQVDVYDYQGGGAASVSSTPLIVRFALVLDPDAGTYSLSVNGGAPVSANFGTPYPFANLVYCSFQGNGQTKILETVIYDQVFSGSALTDLSALS